MNEKVMDILTHGMIIVLKTEIDELFFVCFFASPLAKRGWGGIEPPTSRTLNENHTTRPPAQNINMENAGFDPAASTLRTSHSTDWANPP